MSRLERRWERPCSLLVLLALASGCAVGVVSERRIIGVAIGNAALARCTGSGEDAACARVSGGPLSEPLVQTLRGVLGAVGGLLRGLLVGADPRAEQTSGLAGRLSSESVTPRGEGATLSFAPDRARGGTGFRCRECACGQ